MRVSVVIPAYNAAAYVVEAVQSALAQTLTPYEIIVVDDGSTDDTAAKVRDLPVQLIHQANAGVAKARNAGVAAATGDAIAFLDADDVWHPRKLELQTAALSQADLIATQIFPWPGVMPEVGQQSIKLNRIVFEKLIIRNSVITSTVLVKSQVLRDAGEFDSRMQGPEDYDLWLRIARHHRCAMLPLPLTGYRTIEGSLSKNARRMEEGMRLILNKLEAARVFQGRPLLRAKAHGYFHYSCAYMHKQAGSRAVSKQHIISSLIKYPWFYSRDDVRYFLGRVRLLLS